MKADAAFLAVTLCVLFVPAIKYETLCGADGKKQAPAEINFSLSHFLRLESRLHLNIYKQHTTPAFREVENFLAQQTNKRSVGTIFYRILNYQVSAALRNRV